MRHRGKLLSSIYFLVLFTFSAVAKTDEDPSSSAKAVSPSDFSTEASDATFRAVIKARDDKLAFAAELKQIKTYHDELKDGLNKLFQALPLSYRETYVNIIRDELDRLKQSENQIDSEKDVKAKGELLRTFSKDYPIALNENKVVDFVQSSPNTNPIAFASKEYEKTIQVFQSVGSFENRQFLDAYKTLFSTMKSFGGNIEKEPFSRPLPKDFIEFAGASSYGNISEAQIKLAITKYREILQETHANISQSTVSGKPFIANVTKQVESLSTDILHKSDDLNGQIKGLEKDITLTAKSLYGHTVGENSFYWLLILFAAVFLMIMIMPRFYPPSVAQNVLTSEFILQFSTVFVLVAAIIILSIGGFIAPNQVPVLLAGISGYVLGQLGSNSRSSTRQASTP